MILYMNNIKKIHLNENNLVKLLEGVKFNRNQGEPPIDTTITPIKFGDDSNKDSENTIADTRFFGTKNGILNGDGTLNKRTYTLKDL